MSEFNTFSAWQTLRDLKLASRAERVPIEVARHIEAFRLPVKLHDMWRALPGHPPTADHVTPAWLGAELLPYMYIVDALDDGADFRWRLFGTIHAAQYGTEATGMLMSVAADREQSARHSLEIARQVYRSLEPCFFETEFYGPQGPLKHNSTVVLPLAGKSGQTARLFGCSVWR